MGGRVTPRYGGRKKDDRRALARPDRRGQGGAGFPPRICAQNGRAGPDRAARQSDAGACGVAAEPAKSDYKPTKAGGGGPLKLLFWQAPTLLNPHFAVGGKDQHGSRIFFTSRSRLGIRTAIWCRCSPRRSPTSR